ncbi:MAG: hypothetical protein WD877_01270 [Candidatus Saccharimonadales bacterium]
MTDKNGRMTRRRLWASLATLIIVVLAVFFAVKWVQAQNEADRLASDPQAAARAAVDQTVAKVSKLVALPANETPTLATVSDVSKLKSQTFFAKAENGDKVLIYTQARLAVLYRPAIDKVINIAPLNIGSGTSSGQTDQ